MTKDTRNTGGAECDSIFETLKAKFMEVRGSEDAQELKALAREIEDARFAKQIDREHVASCLRWEQYLLSQASRYQHIQDMQRGPIAPIRDSYIEECEREGVR